MCSRCLKFSNLPNFKRGDNGTESAWLKMTLSPLRVLPSAFYSLPSVQRWRLSFYLSQKLFSHFCLFLIFSPLCFNPSELICGKKNFSCSNSTLFFLQSKRHSYLHLWHQTLEKAFLTVLSLSSWLKWIELNGFLKDYMSFHKKAESFTFLHVPLQPMWRQQLEASFISWATCLICSCGLATTYWAKPRRCQPASSPTWPWPWARSLLGCLKAKVRPMMCFHF